MKIETSTMLLEEALDCVLTRVRWYTTRCYADSSIPESTKLTFNFLCDALGKPHENPWKRFRR